MESVLRVAMPRDADEVLSMDLMVMGVEPITEKKPGILERIQPLDLVYLLETPERDRGIAILTPPLLTALVEVQMSGRVSEAPPPERMPTRTDGVMAAEMFDRWIATMARLLPEAGLDGVFPIEGYTRAPETIRKREADLLLTRRSIG